MGRMRGIAVAVAVVIGTLGSVSPAAADDRVETTMTAGAFLLAADEGKAPKVLVLSANLWEATPGIPHGVPGALIEFWSGPHLLCSALTDPVFRTHLSDYSIASCRTPLSVGTLHALVAGWVEARFNGTDHFQPVSDRAAPFGPYARRMPMF